MDTGWRQEGRVAFQVGAAFFRPQSRMVRDLGVVAAAVLRQRLGRLRVLEVMAGCGVRSLRYGRESGADFLWVNEGNPDLEPILTANLGHNLDAIPHRLTLENGRRLLSRCGGAADYYDLVDVDCFGDGLPELQRALGATRLHGCVYGTSTDGRSLTGHVPNKLLTAYGVVARSHPAAHEQGLRILLGALHQQATALGFGLQPGFAFFTGETYRVWAQLIPQRCAKAEDYGWLGYCHTCGDYQTLGWQQLGRATCGCGMRSLTVSGPLWLGPLHDRDWVAAMAAIAHNWDWRDCGQLLDLFTAEAQMPPYFYTLQAIGKRGKLDLPKRSHLITALHDHGHAASATHINPQAIKTTAALAACVAIAQSL
ncbi:tRNA (guanine-N1)-methyltransferase [Spirulina major CS-329]|uniref:tRNA (guanine-N1)-methyltransferase n=1 Tax=Spirulina TaxID=1154 RepID=UPI00232BAE43|nr:MULTISPECIES: tRNA (guanine-N1)-methyltransferase [Spirulina]MDB9494302.1 tRNA (guanine-N1)-methyltransferase [Spirulina subsalsa CS-330]MDB9504549.1 tRNA (guanine-N1)-methyltransferase [Spirulina major CS-329]